MRLPARTRELIDSAAAVLGKSRTEFMVESARLHATDVLLDQRVFALDAAQSAALAEAFAEAPKANEALRKLMRSKAPWNSLMGESVDGEDGAAPPPRYAAPAPITPDHRIDGFDSGRPALDNWLRARAIDNEGRASRSYVVIATAGAQRGEVVGYYTLATGGVTLSEIPRKYRHNLPNPVPVMVLGRLAVDNRHGGMGLGSAMLREAMRRTLDISRSAGVRMLMVHAIDDEAVSFYRRFGFGIFPTSSRTMYLPVEAIADAL